METIESIISTIASHEDYTLNLVVRGKVAEAHFIAPKTRIIKYGEPLKCLQNLVIDLKGRGIL